MVFRDRATIAPGRPPARRPRKPAVAQRGPAMAGDVSQMAAESLLTVSQAVGAAASLIVRQLGLGLEFVDTFTDVMTMVTRSLSGQARGIVDIASRMQAERSPVAADDYVVVRMPGPLAAGQVAERALVVANETDTPTGTMSFSSSDLVSPSRGRIPRRLVSFDPPELSVPPRGSGEVVVRVRVPGGLPVGRYEGVLRGIRTRGREALLCLDVA